MVYRNIAAGLSSQNPSAGTHGLALVLFAFAGLLSIFTAAQAASVCVVCNQPEATYECLLPDKISASTQPLARRGLRLACLQGLARAKNHGQCAVRKGASGPCIGERVNLSDIIESEALRARAPIGQAVQAEPKEPGAAQPTPPARAKPEPGEPRTLVELTERTLDQTSKQIEQAGKSLEDAGGAASTFMRRSWTCVTSLFADC